MTPQPPRLTTRLGGIDFGRRVTPSTFVAVERLDPPTAWDSFTWSWQPTAPGPTYTILLAERFPLLTEYHQIAETIWKVAQASNIQELRLDETGVGDAVLEIVRQAKPLNATSQLYPIKITGAEHATATTIPRLELLQRTALAFAQGRVKVARGVNGGVRGWPALAAELATLGANGECLGPSDDLAIALGLALWQFPAPKQAGERPGRLL